MAARPPRRALWITSACLARHTGFCSSRSSSVGTGVTIAAGACRAAASSQVDHVSGALAQRASVVGRHCVRLPDGAAAPAVQVLARHRRLAALAASRAVAVGHDQRSGPGGVRAIATAAKKSLSSRGRPSTRARWNPTSSASRLGASSGELHPGQRASRTSPRRRSSVSKRTLHVSHLRWDIRMPGVPRASAR